MLVRGGVAGGRGNERPQICAMVILIQDQSPGFRLCRNTACVVFPGALLADLGFI